MSIANMDKWSSSAEYRAGDIVERTAAWTFEYSPCGNWKPKFTKSKKKWPTVKEAVDAASIWMYVCYENDFPIMVRIVEA